MPQIQINVVKSPSVNNEINVRFDPDGGPLPAIMDFIHKRGQDSTRNKGYRVTNHGQTTVKIQFTGLPNGISVSPPTLTVPPGDFGDFVVTVSESLLMSLDVGVANRSVGIKIESVG